MLSGRVIKEQEEPQQRTISLGRAGVIRFGEKRVHPQTGNEYPAALNHFILDARPEYQEYFKEVYGDKPSKLEIAFISDDPKDSCYDRYELRDKAGKLYGLANGKTDEASIYLYIKNKWEEMTIETRLKYGGTTEFMDGAVTHCESKTGWKRRLTLTFLLPRMTKIIGFFVLHTGGENTSIENLTQTFDSVKELNGTAVLVPFDLILTMAVSDLSGDKRSYPVLSLLCNRGNDPQLGSPEDTKLIGPMDWNL